MFAMHGANTLTSPLQSFSSPWQFPSQFLGYLAFVLLGLVFCLFPDGQFRPRWTRGLVIGWVIVLFAGYFTMLPESFFLPFLLLTISLLGGLLIAQVYRYRHLSGPVQRQQTRWVVLGVGVVLLFEIAIFLLELLFPSFSEEGSLPALLIFGYDVFFIPVLLPLSIGLALLRYRLWDVDILINKALAYGLLTGILAALYAGLVIGLESLVRAITGQASQQPVVIVVSTLAIAALFQPLRERIQKVIDLRFYRRKYDAARAVAAFSATLRNEVDLNQLREQLLAVVQETLQPAHVSLWLRQPERRTGKSPPRLEQESQAPPIPSGG